MSKIKVVCVNCENQIERYPSQCLGTIYCSRECRKIHMQNNNTVVFRCDYCGNDKRVRKSGYKEEGNHFCSRICKDLWQKSGLKGESNPFYNKKHSEETLDKISKSKFGKKRGEDAANYNSKKVACEQCGKETKKTQYLINRSKHLFCSVKCFGMWKSKNNRGENNPAWNPNLTQEEREFERNYPEYYDFIKDVMKRDSYTCDICKKYGGDLNVHHLNGYNWDKENRTNIDNGITLCEKCHKDFHKTYRFGNNTKKQYEEYKRNKHKKESA